MYDEYESVLLQRTEYVRLGKYPEQKGVWEDEITTAEGRLAEIRKTVKSHSQVGALFILKFV